MGPRATVGGVFTNYQNSATHNRVVGADATLRFLSSSALNAWVANSWTKDGPGESTHAGYVGLVLRDDRGNVGLDYTNIGRDFDPALRSEERRVGKECRYRW